MLRKGLRYVVVQHIIALSLYMLATFLSSVAKPVITPFVCICIFVLHGHDQTGIQYNTNSKYVYENADNKSSLHMYKAFT